MTSVTSPLPLNPDGYTVLLGYYHDLRLFAGFDIRKHRTFTIGSPSVQIDMDAIIGALQNGLAFDVKENQEIAVGIRPDNFLAYVTNAQSLHRYGGDDRVLGLLQKASQAYPIPLQEISSLPAQRQMIVTTLSRYARDSNFRQQVLNAYDNRCAVTRSQLRLVEAAHIIPVPSATSIDHVTNGIALSPTMHKAFDNALIFLDEDYKMRINDRKVRELRTDNLHAGLNQLKTYLNKQVYLPADRQQWPSQQFIRDANKLRRITG